MLNVLCPINREIFKKVSSSQGEFKNFNIAENFNADLKDKHKIIIVSKNEQVHKALYSTLQHFSLCGKHIHIFSATSLQEAQVIAEQNKEIILIVIDNNVQVNGSYTVFVDYIHNKLGNKKCCITFKEDLINASYCEEAQNAEENSSDSFHFARERLVDLTRMVMMTTEMESKINNRQNVDSKLDTSYKNKQKDASKFTKDKLYTVLAHDLKEPVGSIKVMLDFLTNEPDLLDQESSKDLLQRVRESATNIHDMLEDFLFWSRMFKQEVYFNPGQVDIGQVVRENITLLKSTAAAKEISLSMNVPENTYAFADTYMITTVIRNLLYNAIKFTGTGGDITITSLVEDGFVEINIEDHGIGIPEEDLVKLFKADVYFSNAGTQEETGAGLGLVLCKDFIERNGGKIGVRSKENTGTTFSFTLPAWSFAELT